MNMGRTWQREKCRATAPFLKCKYALQQNLQNRTVEDGFDSHDVKRLSSGAGAGEGAFVVTPCPT